MSQDVIMGLQNLLTITFVVASMLGMGMALTLGQILKPLRNIRVVLLALVASFIVVPFAAYLLAMIPADPHFKIGILIVGAGAGAPFLLKLADVAEGNVPLAVGLLVMLVLATVVFLPTMFPLVLGDVEVDAIAILEQLVLQMILPLAIGLFAHWRYPEGADSVLPTVQWIANVALVLLIALMVTSNLGDIVRMFGTGVILSIVVLIAIGQLSGWLVGGPDRDDRATVALATGHRNYAAAFVVANSSFADQPDVAVVIASAAVLNMMMSFTLAGELRKRHAKRVERAEARGRRTEAPA